VLFGTGGPCVDISSTYDNAPSSTIETSIANRSSPARGIAEMNRGMKDNMEEAMHDG
jgi:hypothetical protein